MNFKRMFGSLLSLFGILSLTYTALTFVNASEHNPATEQFLTYGVLLGIACLAVGIGLITSMKCES